MTTLEQSSASLTRGTRVTPMDNTRPPSALLTLPPELRNQIYHLLFTTSNAYEIQKATPPTQLPSLADFGKPSLKTNTNTRTPPNNASLLLANRQLYTETHLLYLTSTPFHLSGTYTEPSSFITRLSTLGDAKASSIRHVVLTAQILQLQALNECWNGTPFGHPSLRLDSLTIVPRRPAMCGSAYAEVADLSQSHTLAYILAETLKSLRGVKRVVVRNECCFGESVWRLVYRSLVYRLWRWGGRLCDLGLRELDGECAFEVLCGMGKVERAAELGWQDVLQEVNRLIGAEGSRDGMIEHDVHAEHEP